MASRLFVAGEAGRRAPGRWLRLGLCGALSAGLLAGCTVLGLDDGPADDLRAQRRRWEALGINDYSYEIARSCFCPGPFGYFRIVVLNDKVNTVVYAETGQPIQPTMLAEWFGTIDHVFDQLERVLAGDPGEIVLRFDDRYHFPARAEIDYIKRAVDDETTIVLSNFLKYARLDLAPLANPANQ